LAQKTQLIHSLLVPSSRGAFKKKQIALTITPQFRITKTRKNTTPRVLAFSFQYTYIHKEKDVEKNDYETFDGIHALSSGRFFLLFCFQWRSTHRFQRVVCVVPVNFFALFFGARGCAKCDEVARR